MQSPAGEMRKSQAGITLIELLVAMIILTIVSTMLVGGWISLQRSTAFALRTNQARATARDAVARMSSEFRDAQPRTLPTASPTPTPAPTTALLTVAQPTEADFYSSYNQPGTSGEGSGVGTLCLTRIWLDTTGSAAQKTLYWQRRPVSSPFTGSWEDSGVRKVKLATNVVNNSVANAIAGTSYTAIFTYAYRDATSGNVVWTDTVGTAALDKIIAVRLRLIVDANLSHAPKYIDLTTTVRPRNASGS